MFVRTHQEVVNVRRAIERVGKLSDNVIGIGKFGIGIDGILAWVPGLGELYSMAAGGMLLLLGFRARVPLSVLMQVFVAVGLRSAAGVPAAALLGPLYPVSGIVVDLFRAHKWAADTLARHIDETFYVEGSHRELRDDPALAEEVAQARADGERVVFLR